MPIYKIAYSLPLLLLAGLGLVGGMVLILYGVIPTFQPAHFGRVYAAYGGFLIVLSLLWGWIVDGNMPDRFDVSGALVALAGVSGIMYGRGRRLDHDSSSKRACC